MKLLSTKHITNTIGAAAILCSYNLQAAMIIDNTGAGPTICNTSEVSLSGSNADYCSGYFTPTSYSDSTQTDLVNDSTDGADWDYMYRVEDGIPDTETFMSDIELTLENDDVGQSDGTWTFSWMDNDVLTDPNLPLYVDLAFGFKAGSKNQDAGVAYFFFDDFLLTDDPFETSGSFSLQVDPIALSHESLFVRLGDEPSACPPGTIDRTIPGGPLVCEDPDVTPIPEPAPLFLISTGIIGFWVNRKNLRKAK